jgi:hypothetical protein
MVSEGFPDGVKPEKRNPWPAREGEEKLKLSKGLVISGEHHVYPREVLELPQPCSGIPAKGEEFHAELPVGQFREEGLRAAGEVKKTLDSSLLCVASLTEGRYFVPKLLPGGATGRCSITRRASARRWRCL